jgi:hypothetical protein
VLKKVQEKALKMTTGLKGTICVERCKEARLSTLKERRKLQNLLHMFKILKGLDKAGLDQILARRQ